MVEKPKNPFEQGVASEEAETLRPPKPPVDSERPTQPAEKEPAVVAVGSFEMPMDEEGKVEFHSDAPLGRVDAVTSIGGPTSHYQENQDGFAVVAKKKSLSVFVGDGVGGSEKGRLATKIAGEIFMSKARIDEPLESIFHAMDRDVRKDTDGRGSLTAAAIRIFETEDGEEDVDMVWAGDCRIVTVNDGELVDMLTSRPQNLAQELVNSGQASAVEYYNHPRKNVTMNALGSKYPTAFGRLSSRRMPGDSFVLFSDGLEVTDHEIAKLSKTHRGEALQKALFDLHMARVQDRMFEMEHAPGVMVGRTVFESDNVTIAVVG